MQLILPEGEGWRGAVIRGLRRGSPGGDAVWSLVIKRVYRRVSGDLVPDADGEDLRVADDVAGDDVVHEGDLAITKPASDIVVRGHRSAGAATVQGGRVRVNGATRLIRDADGIEGDDGDAARHLFGFEPRGSSVRAAAAGTWPEPESEMPPVPPPPPPPHPLPDDYSDDYQRYQRRSGGFSGTPLAALPRSGRVEVFQTQDASDTAWEVFYTLPALDARHYTWCGHGPDRASRWCGAAAGELVADTLLVSPDDDTAEILWRAVWPVADHPTERYRRLVVSAEDS